jgi:hypothetical protein
MVFLQFMICVMNLIFLFLLVVPDMARARQRPRAQRLGTARSKSYSVVPVPVNEHDDTENTQHDYFSCLFVPCRTGQPVWPSIIRKACNL